jgi:hypothetical protein
MLACTAPINQERSLVYTSLLSNMNAEARAIAYAEPDDIANPATFDPL